MHAAKNNNLCIGLSGFLRKLQRISHEVGDILDLAALIVMGKDDGVTLFLQGKNFLFSSFHLEYILT
jgi:hypothetical protein